MRVVSVGDRHGAGSPFEHAAQPRFWAGEPIDADAELSRVMAEVAQAMQGAGTALTIHPPGELASVVHVSGLPGLSGIVERLLSSRLPQYELGEPDQHVWVTGEFGNYAPEAIVLPVRELAGHSRLMITVFFASLAAETKAAAEARYLERRPFAVGYFRLWQQERLLRIELQGARAALDRIGLAVMLIAKRGTLAFANKAARRLLDDADGILERNGRLRARNRIDSIELESTVDHILSTLDQPGMPERLPVISVRRDNMAPLIVTVLPAPERATEEGAVAAMVLAVNPDMDVREFALPVCRAFGLTRVETDLAVALASGMTLRLAAEKMKVKEETLKTYLRSIFSKTGTNRQTDLIRMVLLSLVNITDDFTSASITADKHRPAGAGRV